jgi:predicted glycoside hydrolase/deacetylase ChbG (UPF0249 family)
MPRYPNLTADDWGLSPGINAGILEIARLNGGLRISAMACEPYLTKQLDEAKAISEVRFGLHFDLMRRGFFRSPVALAKAFAFASHTKLNELNEWVRNEFQIQVGALHAAKIPIQYLDGHQHVHIIPQVFDAIAPLIRAEKINEVRCPLDWTLGFSTRAVILPWAFGLKRKLRVQGFATLPFCYPDQPTLSDSEKLKRKLDSNSKKEILVHPAAFEDLSVLKIDDPYRSERVREFENLRFLLRS